MVFGGQSKIAITLKCSLLGQTIIVIFRSYTPPALWQVNNVPSDGSWTCNKTISINWLEEDMWSVMLNSKHRKYIILSWFNFFYGLKWVEFSSYQFYEYLFHILRNNVWIAEDSLAMPNIFLKKSVLKKYEWILNNS